MGFNQLINHYSRPGGSDPLVVQLLSACGTDLHLGTEPSQIRGSLVHIGIPQRVDHTLPVHVCQHEELGVQGLRVWQVE